MAGRVKLCAGNTRRPCAPGPPSYIDIRARSFQRRCNSGTNMSPSWEPGFNIGLMRWLVATGI